MRKIGTLFALLLLSICAGAQTPITGTASVCIGSHTTLSNSSTGGTWMSDDPTVAAIGATTGVVTGVGAGVTNVSYTYSGGVAVKAVTVNGAPSVGAISGPTVLCTGATISLTNSATGGSWTSSATGVASVSSAGVVTGIAAGSARITYSMSNSCGSANAVTTVNVLTAPSAGTISGTLGICTGGSSTLSSTGSAGVWMSGNPAVATIDSYINIVNGVSAGTATISYKVTNGCGTSIATKIVTVNSAPSPGIINGTATVCVGTTRTLTSSVTGGTWISADNTTATIGASNGIVAGMAAGTVTISYAVTGTCGTSYATKVVTVNAGAGTSSIAGTLSLCTGGTTTLTDATTGGSWGSGNTSIATVGASTGIVTGVSAGTANITYSATTTCGNLITTAVVTVNSVTAGTISGATTLCTGTSTTLTASISGGTWSSSASVAAVGSATGVVTGIAGGVATITYTTSTYCGTTSATKAITVNAPPTAAAITGASAVCIGSSISMSASVSGGSWISSNAAVATASSAGVVTGVSGGATVISYALSNTCGTTYSVKTVTVNASPSVGAISGPSGVCGGATATLSNTATGGSWSTSDATVATVGASSGVVTGVSGGTATITYTIFSSCGTANAMSVISVVSPATVGSISGAGAVCAGSSLTLTNSVSGGSWSSGNSTVATVGSATGIVTGVNAGTATIYYNNSNACGTASASAVVTINAMPLVSAIAGPTNICPGSSATLSNSYTGGSWSSSDATVASISPTNGIVSGLSGGTATISYTITNSCGTASAGTIVTVTASPSAGTISGATTLCTSQVTTLTNGVSGGTWSSSNAAVATVSSAGVVTAVSSGVATISYTVATGCGSSAATMVLTVSPMASAGTITGLSSVGIGSSITLTDVVSGGVWSASNANASVSAGIVTGVALGADTIYYTVSTSCGMVATSKVVTVGLISAITGTAAVCQGTTTTLSDATPGGVWSSSTPALASISSTGVVTGVSAGTATISYSVSGAATTIVVTVSAYPPAITGNTMLCVGSTSILSNTMTAGTFTSSDASVATVSSSGGVVTGVAAGTATIYYSRSTGCAASTVVTVNNVPAVITGGTVICSGASSTLSDAVMGGTWTSGNGSIATVGSTTGVINGLAPGVANISYTLGSSGCRAITSITVTPLPNLITGTLSMCAGASTTLTNTTTGGSWTSSDNTIATVIASGVVTGVSAGTATMTYTLGTGCARSTIVTVNAVPAAITGTTSMCVGATVSLSNALPGGSWSSSSNAIANVVPTGVVSGIAAGTANITYTVAGCRTSINVTVSGVPVNITGVTKVCPGTTTTLADGTVGGSWSIDNPFFASVGASSGIVTGANAGTATISYTTAAGCYKTIVITVNPLPMPITGSTNVCVGKTIALSTLSAGTTYWTSNNTAVATVNTTGIVTGVSAGSATITYALGTGCTTTYTVSVNALPQPIAGTKTVCLGLVTNLSDAVTGGTWISGNTAVAVADVSTGAVTGASTGFSVITYTLGTGCYTTTTVSVNALPIPISGYGIACAGTATQFSSSYGGTWSSTAPGVATINATTGVATGVSAGTVTISYTYTSTGCATTTVLTVNPALPSIMGTMNACPGLTTTLSNAVAGGSWSSGNVGTATIGSGTGIVLGMGQGTVVISYSLGTNCRTTTIVTVNPLPQTIAGSTTMCNTMTANLSDVTPGGTWSSSNTAAATVGLTNGVVYGVAAGVATITYTLPTGCYVTSNMTVYGCIRPGEPNAASAATEVKLYPNPTSGQVTLETPGAGILYVYSLDGKAIANYEVKAGGIMISLPLDLATGVYICRFTADGGGTTMIRLVYEK